MPDFSVEDKKRQLDFNNIAGVDEAGRGPWAGPVYSAIVILNRNCIPAVSYTHLTLPTICSV